MNGRMLCFMLAMIISSSSALAFTDSVWIVGAEGYAGDLVRVEVWLQYEGGGLGDSMSAFDIPLTWNAGVCTVEAVTIGDDFRWFQRQALIDNQGVAGPPSVPKTCASAFMIMPIGPPFVDRGTHLAAMVDFRILNAATATDSTYIDTLLEAFSPPIYLGLVDKWGMHIYEPAYEGGWVSVSTTGLDDGFVEHESQSVHGFLRCHPNPIHTTASIFYQVADRCHVRLQIHDVAGRFVKALVQQEVDRGHHSAEWDGKDCLGKRVGSGVYFVSLIAGECAITRKLCVVR